MNMENQDGGGGVVVRGRVEIDMRQPFRSVKEAVSLFGEKVLAGEVYGTKLKQMQTKKGNHNITGPSEEQSRSNDVVVPTPDVEETNKQSIEKSKEEENHLMAYYLSSLRKELEQTKKELQLLKSSREFISDHHHHRNIHNNPPDPIDCCNEIEELKFVENPAAATTKTINNNEAKAQPLKHHHPFVELEKKRSVKFASPPLLTRVIISKDEEEVQSSPSVNVMEKKVKRKPLIPVLGFLFARKKGHQKSGADSLRA